MSKSLTVPKMRLSFCLLLSMLGQIALAQEITFWMDPEHPTSQTVKEAVIKSAGETFEILSFLNVKPRLKLVLGNERSKASFVYPDTIVIPPSLKEGLDASLIHEITHAYFDQGIAVFLPGCAEINAISDLMLITNGKILEKNNEIKNLQNQLRIKLNGVGEQNQCDCVALENQIRENLSSLKALMNGPLDAARAVNMKGILAAIEPYSELFSDLVTAAVLDDPKAVLSVEGYGSAIYRDLSESTPAKGWNRSEPHILLHPAGHFIWERYFGNRSLTKAEKMKALMRVRDAITAELTFVLARPTLLKGLSPEKLNQRIIDTLNAQQSLRD